MVVGQIVQLDTGKVCRPKYPLAPLRPGVTPAQVLAIGVTGEIPGAHLPWDLSQPHHLELTEEVRISIFCPDFSGHRKMSLKSSEETLGLPSLQGARTWGKCLLPARAGKPEG